MPRALFRRVLRRGAKGERREDKFSAILIHDELDAADVATIHEPWIRPLVSMLNRRAARWTGPGHGLLPCLMLAVTA